MELSTRCIFKMKGAVMSNDLQLFDFRGQPVRVVFVDGEPWWVAADVCRVLEISNVSQAVASLDDDEKGISEVYTPGGKQKMLCINQTGLRKFIVKSRKSMAVELAISVGLEVDTLFCSSKEQHTLFIIAAAFSHIRQISQCSVNGYRIDLYFPDYKIAVECDENGHKKYSSDRERQAYLEEVLGCSFVRYNPDEDGFNVGSVINQIMKALYHSDGKRGA